MTTLTTIAAHLADVTSEQIGACTKVYDFQAKQWIYLVENSRNARNEKGQLIEYRVRWNRSQGFSCTCESAKYGWANVHHPSGVCWHVRAAVAAAREERAAAAEIAVEQVEEEVKQEAPVLIVDGKQADQATLDRVMNAEAKPVDRKAKPYQPKAFSLLK